MKKAEKNLIELMGVPIFSDFLSIGPYRIHYIKTGSGSPLVLIHGINFGWGEWYKTIPDLATRFTVYIMDLPGAGNSTKINFSETNVTDLYPEIVKNFILKLGLENVILIGHSIGGWIALKLAMDPTLKIKKIAVVNSLGFSDYLVWKQRPLVFYRLAHFLSKTAMKLNRKNIYSFLKSVFHDPKKLPPELVDYYFEAISPFPHSHPFLLINQLIKPFYIRSEFVLSKELKKISIPVAIFAGQYDPLLPLFRNRNNFSKISNETTYIIPNVGHVSQIENPKIFNKHIISFIET